MSAPYFGLYKGRIDEFVCAMYALKGAVSPKTASLIIKVWVDKFAEGFKNSSIRMYYFDQGVMLHATNIVFDPGLPLISNFDVCMGEFVTAFLGIEHNGHDPLSVNFNQPTTDYAMEVATLTSVTGGTYSYSTTTLVRSAYSESHVKMRAASIDFPHE